MEEKKEKKPLVLLAKLQKMRVELLKCDLKMSGQNTYSKYDYFQLSDFMPAVLNIMLENNVVSINEISEKEAVLKLINLDDTSDMLIFSLPLAEAGVKGASGVQQVGAQSTYYRRYLYMIAFEISEADIQAQQPPQEPKIAAPDLTVKVTEIEKNTIKKMLEETNVAEKSILDRYHIEKLEDMTKEDFYKAMKALEATKQKSAKK